MGTGSGDQALTSAPNLDLESEVRSEEEVPSQSPALVPGRGRAAPAPGGATGPGCG